MSAYTALFDCSGTVLERHESFLKDSHPLSFSNAVGARRQFDCFEEVYYLCSCLNLSTSSTYTVSNTVYCSSCLSSFCSKLDPFLGSLQPGFYIKSAPALLVNPECNFCLSSLSGISGLLGIDYSLLLPAHKLFVRALKKYGNPLAKDFNPVYDPATGRVGFQGRPRVPGEVSYSAKLRTFNEHVTKLS